MKKSDKGLPTLSRSTLSKKSQDEEDRIKKNYMKLLSGGMIVDSNHIGTILNGWIQEFKPKGINPFQFLQENFT